MSQETKNAGNTLVNPAEHANRQVKDLEQGRDSGEIERLETHLAHRLRLDGAITYVDENDNHVIEDLEGVRPFSRGSEFSTPLKNAKLEIRELAFQHDVNGDKTELDDWYEAVSANAGDEIQSNEIEQLIIGLRRLRRVDGITLRKLHARYMQELGSIGTKVREVPQDLACCGDASGFFSAS